MLRTSTTAETRSSKSRLIPPAICYRLSDKFFLDYGWTTKPNVSLAFPIIIMKAKFSHAIISPWFQERSQNLTMKYSNGKVLYVAKTDGTGKIYYPNGKLAVKIEKGGVNCFRTRLWVYSPGEVDREGKRCPPQLCALFDSLGNGVVYDSSMKKRLVYNQREGILWDSPNGVPIAWKWHNISFSGSLTVMNEEDERHKTLPDALKSVSFETSKDVKGPPEKEWEKSLATDPVNSFSLLSTKLTKSEIIFRRSFENSRYLDTSKTLPKDVSPIKPMVLRLNRYLALRIHSQSDISLSFWAETHQTTLKIGVLYNPFDKLKVVEVEDPSWAFEKVICPFEVLPPKTRSMLKFKMIVQSIRMASCK